MQKAEDALSRRKISMWLSAKKYFYLLLLLSLVMLLMPQIIRLRSNNGLFIGSEAYTTLRTAQYIHDNKALPTADSLSYGGKPFISEYGWPLLLAINPTFLGRWLPLIF